MTEDSSIELIIAESPDGHLVFENGQCVYHSPSYRRIVGYPEGKSLDQNATALRNLLHEHDREPILEFFEEAVQEKREFISYTFRGRQYDGSYGWRHDSAHLVYDETGAHVRTYVAARHAQDSSDTLTLDLRERRAGERAREVSHRVKNDFELVRSLLSLQASEEESEAGARAIREAADRLTAIGRTYETLHRSRDLQTVSTSSLLADLEPMLSEKAASRGISLVIDNHEEQQISASLAQTISIVMNELVTNSVKYLENHAQPRIHLRLTRLSRPTALVLRVADNGRGYAPEVLNFDTTGFGLQIVQNLADQHDGAVKLYNDGGAVAEVLLPLQ